MCLSRQHPVQQHAKKVGMYDLEKYGGFGVSGRTSATAGFVISNITESRKKVGRS